MWVSILLFCLTLGPMYRISFGGIGYVLYYSELFLIGSFFYGVLKHRKNKLNVKQYKMLLFFLVMIVANTVIGLWSEDKQSIFVQDIAFIFSILTIVLCSIFDISLKDFLKGCRIFLISISIQILLLYLFKLDFNQSSYYGMKNQVIILMGGSNYLSIFLSFILILEIILGERYWKIFSFLAMTMILLTFSKGAIVAVLLSLIILIVLSVRNNKISVFKISALIISMFSVGMIFLKYTLVGNRLLNGILLTIRTGNNAGRVILVTNAFQEFQNNILGNRLLTSIDPHNFVLRALMDFGIVFGTAYIIFLIKPILKLLYFNKRLEKEELALTLAYLSIMIHSTQEIFLFSSQSLIWLMIIRYLMLANRKVKNIESEVY